MELDYQTAKKLTKVEGDTMIIEIRGNPKIIVSAMGALLKQLHRHLPSDEKVDFSERVGPWSGGEMLHSAAEQEKWVYSVFCSEEWAAVITLSAPEFFE